MWIARDKDGTLVLYKGKPVRSSFDKETWVTFGENWQCFEIDSSLFPNLKWEDDPIEANILGAEDIQDIKDDYYQRGYDDGYDVGYTNCEKWNNKHNGIGND